VPKKSGLHDLILENVRYSRNLKVSALVVAKEGLLRNIALFHLGFL